MKHTEKLQHSKDKMYVTYTNKNTQPFFSGLSQIYSPFTIARYNLATLCSLTDEVGRSQSSPTFQEWECLLAMNTGNTRSITTIKSSLI